MSPSLSFPSVEAPSRHASDGDMERATKRKIRAGEYDRGVAGNSREFLQGDLNTAGSQVSGDRCGLNESSTLALTPIYCKKTAVRRGDSSQTDWSPS